MLSSWLSADVEDNGDAVRVVLSGEVDVAGSVPLRRLLGRYARRHVLVDLAATSFIDTAAVAAMLEVERVAVESGGSVGLTGVAAHRRALLALLGASPLLGPFAAA